MWIEWLNNIKTGAISFWESIDVSKVVDLFVYDEQNPLMFNTGLFLFLFVGFIWIYRLLERRDTLRIYFVILFSLYFYYKSSGLCFLLLLFVALSDYSLGRLLGWVSRKWLRRFFVLMSMAVNLGMLCYFKYTNLLLGTIADFTREPFEPLDIVLPIGISFFTFRSLSYIVDVYRRQMSPVTSLRDYVFYLSFFPPLAAGPVVRAKDFVPQIHRPLEITPMLLGEGLFLVMCGLIKKVVISDYISVNFVDRIFDNPMLYTGFENLMGVYGYTLQIYCDFSGYSDMAIGLGAVLGFHFPENFNYPYIAASVKDFWHRWHISLSTWFKEYVYIPLGGNRKGLPRQLFNILVVWMLTGIWHGAGWNFLFWGLWFAFFLILEKLFLGDILESVPKVFGRIYTLAVVLISWVFFALESPGEILAYLQAMFGMNGIGPVNSLAMFLCNEYLVLLVIALVACLPLGSRLVHALKSSKTGPAMALYRLGEKVIPAVLLLLSVAYIVDASYNPFLYFRF